MRSQVIVGDAYTTGETFDSVNVRGMRLYSDSRMLPSALASYAPIIRGVASSNAKVSVTQNGYKIYESTVPPGEFVIDDLSPSGFGSELVITIEEADGSKRSFTQPFSSVVQLQRHGVGRWDISAGQIIDDSLRHEPNMAQASFTTVSIICSPVIPAYKLQITIICLAFWGLGSTPASVPLRWTSHMPAPKFLTIKHIRGKAIVLPRTNCSKLQAPHLTLLLIVIPPRIISVYMMR